MGTDLTYHVWFCLRVTEHPGQGGHNLICLSSERPYLDPTMLALIHLYQRSSFAENLTVLHTAFIKALSNYMLCND